MSPRRLSLRSALGPIVLSAAIFTVYGTVLHNDFVQWDDGHLITENPIVQELSFHTVGKAFTTYDPELYIPLTFLSYQFDHLLWGLNPVGFHLTNLVLHTLNAILVFWLMTLLLQRFQGPENRSQENSHHSAFFIPHSPFPALAIALLWALHPLNTEAVAWASARKDLLSGFFFLSSLLVYVHWRADGIPKTFFWSILLFFFGLLAKVSIVVLPALLLLIDWLQGRRINRRTILEKTPYILLSTVFGIIAILGKTRNVASTSLLESLLLGTKSTVFYLGHLLLPSHLSVLYPYTNPLSFGNLDLFIPFLLTVGLLTLTWTARRHFPILTFAFAWYLLLLLPSFTTFRKGDDIALDLYFASDRYAYLPSIALFLLVVSLGASLCLRARTHRDEHYHQGIATSLAGAIIVCFGILSFRQTQTWHTTEALFQNVVRSYPNSHIAYNNLGLFQQGRGNTTGAIDYFQQSLAIRPTGRTYYNLGLAYIAQGEREKAMEANRTATTLNPRHARAHLNLGGLLLENGQLTEATQEFHTAISLDPELALAHFNLGLAYERLRKLPLAENAYTAALEKDPNDIETLVSLASLLVQQRRLDDALTLLQHAIALQPHHPRYESLLLEIARLQGKKISF